VDKYKDMGTVVMGKVEAGEAKKGQTLLVLPNKVRSNLVNEEAIVENLL
jgi:translation elongation factor EF-1alpha